MVAARICPSVSGGRLSNGCGSFAMTSGPNLVPPIEGMGRHNPAKLSLTPDPGHRAIRKPDSSQPAAEIN